MKDFIKDIVIACSVVLVISFFIKPTVVCGSSMEPSFEDGDYLLTIKHVYQVSAPERGDVVVFPAEHEDKLYIKRIIGLPGDVITIKDGDVFVNGERENADYTLEDNTPGNLENYTVPQGELFVLGDNRCNSMDSRQIGTQKIGKVKWAVVLRLWPMYRIGVIQ